MFKIITKNMVGIILLLWIVPAIALAQPTPEEMKASIDNGVTWLVAQQNPNGSWGDETQGEWGEIIAHTGFALTKLCDYAKENGLSPFDDPAIMNGFDYLFSMVKSHGEGLGLTVSSSICWHHETYNAAVGLMAFANLGDPDYIIDYDANPLVDGLTISQLITEMVTYFAWSQEANGGWGYNPCDTWEDNSHTGYVVLALRYAEEAGVTIPAALKTNLSAFIDLIQDDVTGESYYTPTWIWPNALKQGNLLLEMAFVGDAVTDARDQAALAYLASIWDEPYTDIFEKGWKDPQAMYCLMKGFESFGIETIKVGDVERDWFAEFSTYLLATQQLDGSWPWTLWADPIVSTCWSLFVLEKVAPPPPLVLVDFDIHPMSWPNPINIKSKGVTPTAILGTAEFDVMQIDIATLMLEGVAPVSWYYEDVTGPASSDGVCNDMYMEPDGIMDLTLKFNTQELLAAIAPVAPGDERVLKITGKLLEGRNIEGDDCIKIVNNNLKSAIMGSGDVFEFGLSQNYPNPFSKNTRITYRLAEDTDVAIQVYTLLGQRVHTLVNQYQNAGEYSIEWNGNNLQSGTYLCKMVASGFTDVKTLIINR